MTTKEKKKKNKEFGGEFKDPIDVTNAVKANWSKQVQVWERLVKIKETTKKLKEEHKALEKEHKELMNIMMMRC